METRIILASSSKYRRSLLSRLFADIDCIAPNIDERSLEANSPDELAIKLALAKANAVSHACAPESLIIGSDQLAIVNDRELHKPGNRENNIKQLLACSGKSVVFHTGVCVLNNATGETLTDCDQTVVQFRKLTLNEVENYVEREPSFDCAGGFKVEGLGISLFESIKTEDPNALIGLPLIKLCRLMARFGVQAL